MTEPSTLVSWVGNTDWKAWWHLGPAVARNLLAKKYGDRYEPTADDQKRITAGAPGPLKTAAESGRFRVVHLLSELDDEVIAAFGKWLGVEVKSHPVKLDDPTDYEAIYRAAEKVLQKLRHLDRECLNFFLTPGTPTMAATWILLGKTLFPARLWQSFRGKMTVTELPVDLSLFERHVLQRRDAAVLKLADELPPGFDPIIGKSQAIREAKARTARVARHDAGVLLLGESGTGKELFARAIHAASGRSGQLIPVNCAAIPEQLLESLLFGHKKDAFTGATRDRDGDFKRADRGTLFLDEVGELPPAIQAKLLRVLQPPADAPCLRRFTPLGSDREEKADVRIIAATNKNLLEMVPTAFREDLYYRLAQFTIRLPSLAERQEDVPLIAQELLKQIRRALRPDPGALRLSADAEHFVRTRRWRGNVRQLYNVLLQAAVLTNGQEIGQHDLEAAAHDIGEVPGATGDFAFGGKQALRDYLDAVRDRLYEEALRRTDGNQSRAAKLLGVSAAAVSKRPK